MKELWKILAYALIGVLLCTNLYQCHRGRTAAPPPGTYTDTIPYYDTIPVYKPVPRDSVHITYITETLPAANKETPSGDKISPSDSAYSSINGQNKPFGDSLTVQIPVTQKIYENGLYRAYVSGYRATLDSLLLFQTTKVIHHREKPKPWDVGLIGGFDASRYGATVNAGAEVSYTKGRWTYSVQGGYMADRNGGYPYGGASVKFSLFKW